MSAGGPRVGLGWGNGGWTPLHAGAGEAVRFPAGDLAIAALLLGLLAVVGFGIHHLVRRRRGDRDFHPRGR